MLLLKRRVAIIGVCIGAAMSCSWLVLAQQSPAADEAPQPTGQLQLVVPAELPPVRFGDPIYVPLAVRNFTNMALPAPLFTSHNPDFSYAVSSGREVVECHDYGQALSRGDAHTLPPGNIETTVIMVNVWTPAIALEFLRTGKARIDFNAYLSQAPERPGLKATTMVRQSGRQSPFVEEFSVFTGEGHERLWKIARTVSSPEFNDSPAAMLRSGRASSTAFTKGQSPLYWLDFNDEREEAWDVGSDFYREAKRLVVRESALYRMMTFIELRDELRGVLPEPERKSSETLDVYFKLLGQCHPSERHFQIVALNAVGTGNFPLAVREPEMSWEEICAEMRQREPTYSMYFNGMGGSPNPTYSTVSRMGHRGALP